MARKKNVNTIYLLAGYYSDASHPDIINDFLIKDVENGRTFKASVLEARKLYQDGLLDINTEDMSATHDIFQ